MAEPRLPFVQIATFCDRVLREQDDVLSVIRMIDTIFVDPSAIKAAESPAYVRTVFIVALKGEHGGTHDVRLRIRRPDAKHEELHTWRVEFRGASQGNALVVDYAFDARIAGLYWVDVMVGEAVLTSVPLTLSLRQPQPIDPSGSEKSPQIRGPHSVADAQL